MTQTPMRIALCFFGITRSVRHTHASIAQNVVAPLRAAGDLRLYGHFFAQERIENPRSGEFGTLDPEEHRHLGLDTVAFDAPEGDDVQALYDAVVPFGAGWKGDFKSLRNLCHQLVSLQKVWQLSQDRDADLYVFCRPDLMYHDSLRDVIAMAVTAPVGTVFLPYWQASGGLNDRFAVIRGRDAAEAYALRGRQALAYCQAVSDVLAAERLVGFVLKDRDVREIPHRATRIRFDGSRQREEFDTRRTTALRQWAKRNVRQPGLRSLSIRAIRVGQALIVGPRYSGLDTDWRAMPQRSNPPDTPRDTHADAPQTFASAQASSSNERD